MFGENKASTFNKNLEKMIALVLFDKYNTGLTITDIIADIRDKYALDFSDSEIIGLFVIKIRIGLFRSMKREMKCLRHILYPQKNMKKSERKQMTPRLEKSWNCF